MSRWSELLLLATLALANVNTGHAGSAAPQDVEACRWNRTSATLRWRALPALPNGQRLNYTVSVDGFPGHWVSADSSCAAWRGMLCYDVRWPRRGSSKHSVVVAAIDGSQRGAEARIVVNVTDAKPDAVEGLVASPRIDVAVLRWNLPRRLRGDLKLFVVLLTRSGDVSHNEDLPDPGPIVVPVEDERPFYEAVVRDLQPHTTYTASVRCLATGGTSEATVAFTTRWIDF